MSALLVRRVLIEGCCADREMPTLKTEGLITSISETEEVEEDEAWLREPASASEIET